MEADELLTVLKKKRIAKSDYLIEKIKQLCLRLIFLKNLWFRIFMF